MKLILIGAYLLLLALIGVFSLKRSRQPSEFFLAGRSIGLLRVSLATMASIMSGFVFVGGPGLFYEIGMSSLWIILSSSFTGAMICWILAKPLYRAASEMGCLTIPDVILAHGGSRLAGMLSSLAILCGVTGYLATQLQALGVIMSSMLELSALQATVLGGAVLVFYSSAGGMVAGIYTDVVQGIVMLVATLAVFIAAIAAGGGPGEISEVILAHEPPILEPFGHVGVFAALSWFFVFAVGALGQPHVVTKLMMVSSMKSLRALPVILACTMVVCGLIWLGVGLCVKKMVLDGSLPPVTSADQTINVFLNQVAPVWLAALAYVGVVAAIMSTADSFLNIGAGVLTNDLPKSLGIAVNRQVLWGRVWSIGIAVLALLLSYAMRELTAYLGIVSFSVFAASLTPVLVLGTRETAPQKRSFQASLAVGLTLGVGLEFLRQVGWYQLSLSPALVSLALSFLAYLLFQRPDRKRSASSS